MDVLKKNNHGEVYEGKILQSISLSIYDGGCYVNALAKVSLGRISTLQILRNSTFVDIHSYIYLYIEVIIIITYHDRLYILPYSLEKLSQNSMLNFDPSISKLKLASLFAF